MTTPNTIATRPSGQQAPGPAPSPAPSKGPPVSGGTYAAIPRNLTETDEWADLSVQARLVGLTAFSRMPSTPVASLPAAILSAFTGLTRAQCAAALAELAEAGYLVRISDGRWVAPVLLDAMTSRSMTRSMARAMGEIRQLPEDAKAALAERHPWCLKRVKDVVKPAAKPAAASHASALVGVAEHSKEKDQGQVSNLPGDTLPAKASGDSRQTGGRWVAPVSATREAHGNGKGTSTPLPGKMPSLTNLLRQQGHCPPGEVPAKIMDVAEAATFEAKKAEAKALAKGVLKAAEVVAEAAA